MESDKAALFAGSGRPLRILLSADPELPVPPVHYGGIERIVDSLVRAFVKGGHSVALVAHRDSRSPATQTYRWPGRSSTERSDTLRNALALHRVVRDFRPDIIHSFSRLAYLLPLLANRRPKIMSYQRHTGGLQIALAARLGGRAIRFTGCSKFICAQGSRTAGSWHAIPNFVEPGRFTFKASVPPDAPLVFLSRIESIKGPDVAIDIALASGRRLILAGNHATHGPEHRFWQDKIAPRLGRDGIEWIGEVDDAQKNELLGRAAALVVPVRWDEPFGIVFAESLACGTPILSCPRGALPEIVEPGRTGWLFGSTADGVAAARRLAALDRAACRTRAETEFSLELAVARYLALYRSML